MTFLPGPQPSPPHHPTTHIRTHAQRTITPHTHFAACYCAHPAGTAGSGTPATRRPSTPSPTWTRPPSPTSRRTRRASGPTPSSPGSSPLSATAGCGSECGVVVVGGVGGWGGRGARGRLGMSAVARPCRSALAARRHRGSKVPSRHPPLMSASLPHAPYVPFPLLMHNPPPPPPPCAYLAGTTRRRCACASSTCSTSRPGQSPTPCWCRCGPPLPTPRRLCLPAGVVPGCTCRSTTPSARLPVWQRAWTAEGQLPALAPRLRQPAPLARAVWTHPHKRCNSPAAAICHPQRQTTCLRQPGHG